LRFETLLSDLSSRFINMPAAQVDLEIDDALRKVCESMGFDVAVLWQWEADTPGLFTLTHHYRRLEGPPLSRQVQAEESFPWGLREVQAGRSFLLASLDDVPEGAARDQESYRKFGVKNALVLILAVGGGAPFGAISFHDMVTPRVWSDALIRWLELVARIFANAIVRKRSEQALRDREEHLSLATEAAGAGPWILDAKGERFWVGSKTMELLGLPPDNALEVERFMELIHPDDRQAVRDAMAEGIASREARVVEYRIVRPDGEIRWLLTRGRMCARGTGTPAQLMGITADITERKQVEETLARANYQNQLILTAAAQGILRVDLHGDLVFVNPSAARMLGHAPEDLAGRNAHCVWHHSREDGKSYPESECPICTTCRNGVEHHVTSDVFWRKDGTCFPVEYKCTPILEQGRRTGAVITFDDVTERRKMDEALRENAARIAAAMDVAELGFYEVTNGDRVTYLDRRAREIIGASKADEEAGRVFEFWAGHVHPEDLPGVMELNRVLNEGGQDRLTVDYRFLKPERGVIFIHHLAHVIERDASGRAVRTIGVLQDITERRKMDMALRESGALTAAALEVAGLGVYELLNGVRVTYSDHRAGEILGLSEADEKAGRILEFWFEHLHPEDLPRVLEVRREMEEAGVDRKTVDYRFLNPERGVIFIRHLVHVMERDAAGRAVRTIGILQDVSVQKNTEASLRQALDEVQRLQDQLQKENVYLREQMRTESGHGTIVGESEAIQRMLALAGKVAITGAAVLITGETGTGKELLAQAIHDLSSRKATTMVKVNCAALPAPLIESELFGREKGAYTGAMTQQVGRFEIADGSTIFLDEIGDLPLDLQVKLLRVLQDGEFQRLGSHRTLKVDVRVIAATNRDLAAMVREGRYREDLFHRLNVFPIVAPTLRERITDIPLLVWKFVEVFNRKMGRSIDSIPKPLMERLKQYHWPGNVRELRNMVERAMIVSEGRTLMIELPDGHSASAPAPSKTLTDVERHHILDVLESTRWRISGKGGAAEVLGLQRSTLRSRMKNLGIVRP
jgi:PAS domain S-box-containing protein